MRENYNTGYIVTRNILVTYCMYIKYIELVINNGQLWDTEREKVGVIHRRSVFLDAVGLW